MGKVNYPKGEKVWMTYYSSAHEIQYIITTKQNNRDNYYCYEYTDDGIFKKVGRAKSPTDLEEKYIC